MTEEEKFKNLLVNNKEWAANFMNEDLGVQWIAAITKHVAAWVAEKDKAAWEIVRFASDRNGFVKPKVGRPVFANMVYAFCKEVLPKDETTAKIKHNMERSKYNKELKDFDHLPESNLTRGLVEEVSNFLKTVVVDDRKDIPHTIASRLEAYLRATVKEDANTMPCSRIRINPDYGNDMTPNLSIEKYVNKTLLDQKKPSYIEAYECLSDELKKDTLRVYIQKYADRRDIKLFLVGQHGLSNDVYELAADKSIGYVLINPRHEMTSDSYLLPRSVGDANSTRNYREMLTGQKPMQTPLLICQGEHVTPSLAESLQARAIPIKASFALKAPKLRNEEIEAKANELTSDYVNTFKEHYSELTKVLSIESPILVKKRKTGRNYVEKKPHLEWNDISFDVFQKVQRQGLEYEYSDLPSGQLGCINLQEKKILLNNAGMDNYQRLRFTMAHEYGHYVLHSDLLKSQGINSFGDTEDTITDLLTIRDEERKWLEQQANHFAACLLMPKDIIVLIYCTLHKKYIEDVYNDPLGPIYYNEHQPETYKTYNIIVGGMAKLLDVSKQAMELRLISFNMLKKG